MSTEKIHDYLTKQLSIENAVVTFRLLSREMKIHVNAAKKELEEYRNNVDSYATYVISGLLPRSQRSYSEDTGMDVDGDYEGWDEDYDSSDDVQEMQTLLVGEENLESSKSQFFKIHSIHVYSLSPARLLDPDLFGPATEKVRHIDASDTGQALVITVGKIIGPHVVKAETIPVRKGKEKPVVTAASSSKLKATTVKVVTKEKAQEQPKAGVLEHKNSTGSGGLLDWSKAKSKEDVKKTKEREKQEKEKERQQKGEIKKPEEMIEPAAPKRGAKRKSSARDISDPESSDKSEVIPPIPDKAGNKASSSTTHARVKKGIVLSDDDDSEPVKYKGKMRSRRKDLEPVRSVRAMMDIDDDEVEKVSRVISKSTLRDELEEEEKAKEEEEENTKSEYEEPEPAVIKRKPRKVKEKKVIPVGKNGLKKKRIVKSRMQVDEKGYMVTEDYSSYESVDEEEQEQLEEKASSKKKGGAKPAETKTKAKASSSKELKKKESLNDTTAKSKANDESTKSRSGQKNLMNFFGKKS